MISASVATIVLFSRFSAQSLANAFCTVSVTSSVARRSTRIGLIHISKMGLVKRFSSSPKQLCHKYSSLEGNTAVVSIRSISLFAIPLTKKVRTVCEADPGSGHRALARKKRYSFSVRQLSLCTYAQHSRAHCG